MAKPVKPLPARRAQVRDDSLLLRSAESLGRIIGRLQRQLESASRPSSTADGVERDSAAGRKRASGKRGENARSMAAAGEAKKKPVRKASGRKARRTR